MSAVPLSSAPVGARFRVLRVVLDREVGRRLADMGFTSGTEGRVVRGGLMRGPLQVLIRGYDLLIRRGEAAGIEVEPLNDWAALAARSMMKGVSFLGGFPLLRGHGAGNRRQGGRGGRHRGARPDEAVDGQR